VAIDGNLLAAMSFSLPRLPSGEPGSTTVYIFEREGGEQPWRFVGQPGPAQPFPGFATRVDVAGDTIAISTRPAFDSTRTYLPNAVSLFRRNQGGANAWGEIKRLPVPPEAVGFGAGLALDGATVAVGAPQTDLGNRPGGAVYLFERNISGADGWGQLTTLHGSFSSPADDLGMEVALDRNTLAAGAGGTVYAYRNGVRNPTGLGLHTEANSPQPGQPVTLKATISGAAGGAEDGAALALSVPQGVVAFFLNGEPAGAAQLDAQGQASLTLTGLPLGVHELTARFAGNDRWTACESPPLTLFVGVEPSVPVPDTLTIFLPLLQR